MKVEKYEQAKRLVDAADSINQFLGSIETKVGLGENLSAGVYVHISKDNLDWFVGVCKERYKDLYRQLDEL